MNCRDFTERMDDLARGALMDARVREESLAHEAACTACAARLADALSLGAGLRALAERDAEQSAPPRVEAELLAAFRARHAAGGGPASDAPARVSKLSDARDIKRRTWARALAAAATTAAAAAAAFVMILSPSDAPSPAAPARQQVAEVKPETTERPGAEAAASAHIPVASAPAAVADQPAAVELAAARVTKPQKARAALNAGAGRASVIKAGAGRGAEEEADASGDEFATDFISLAQAGQDATVVAGQLVRVELPRSALSNFGLPVSAEGASERVKADVLLGEDGMARAIRFVR